MELSYIWHSLGKKEICDWTFVNFISLSSRTDTSSSIQTSGITWLTNLLWKNTHIHVPLLYVNIQDTLYIVHVILKKTSLYTLKTVFVISFGWKKYLVFFHAVTINLSVLFKRVIASLVYVYFARISVECIVLFIHVDFKFKIKLTLSYPLF